MPPRAATKGSPGDLVAVFIDLENLALGAGEDLPGEAEPIPYKALERLCRDYGNTSIRRAYADWSRPEFGRYQHSLAQNGITLIQVTRFGAPAEERRRHPDGGRRDGGADHPSRCRHVPAGRGRR